MASMQCTIECYQTDSPEATTLWQESLHPCKKPYVIDNYNLITIFSNLQTLDMDSALINGECRFMHRFSKRWMTMDGACNVLRATVEFHGDDCFAD